LPDEFAGHGGQHVIVIFERLQAVADELASMANGTSSFLPVKRRQLSCMLLA
jgi:hypothetical protein